LVAGLCPIASNLRAILNTRRGVHEEICALALRSPLLQLFRLFLGSLCKSIQHVEEHHAANHHAEVFDKFAPEEKVIKLGDFSFTINAGQVRPNLESIVDQAAHEDKANHDNVQPGCPLVRLVRRMINDKAF